MTSIGRRVYALADYTVECRSNGWYYARTNRFGDRSEMRGPYGSVAMIARQLRKEIEKRDAPLPVET